MRAVALAATLLLGACATAPVPRLSPSEGLVVKHGVHRLHAGGVVALDYRQYDSRNTRDSGLRADRVVARVDGRHGDAWRWRVGADLRGTDTRTNLEEAWLAYAPARAFRVSAGLLQMPMGIDDAVAEEDLAIVGYSSGSYIDFRTDLGVRIDGEVGDGALYWAATAAFGEGFDLTGGVQDDPRLALQLVAFPFRALAVAPLAGFYLSGAVAWTDGYRGDLAILTPLDNRAFLVRDLDADRSRTFHLAIGIDAGPVHVSVESVPGETFEQWFGSGSGYFGVDTPTGPQDFDQVGTWELTARWTITGEPYDSRPFGAREHRGRAGAFPARPVFGGDPDTRGIGAIEAVFRYANADIDRGFFEAGFTDETLSSQEFRTITGAVNWHLTRGARVTAQIVRTIADGAPAAFGSGGRDTSFVLRAQVDF